MLNVDPAIITLIVAAGLVSYICRIAGFWIMGRVPIGPRVRRGLEALPGATIMAIVAPAAVTGGPAALIAIGAGVGMALWLKRDLLALAVGLLTAIGLRAVGL